MSSEPLRVLAEVAMVLERLEIPYFVGGSTASSMYGIPRSTQDVDIVAALDLKHVRGLVDALDPSFHVDEEMIRRSIREKVPFNVIHEETLYKVDVFITEDDEWIRSELETARPETLSVGGTDITVMFATAEDIVLHKLKSYRMGDEVSERQWSDLRGLIKVQSGALDDAYLDPGPARREHSLQLRVSVRENAPVGDEFGLQIDF
jgi:hypothetical protein